MQTVIVTGGAGFIGSALIRHLIAHDTCRIVNVDRLTYAGNTATLKDIDQDPRYCLPSEEKVCEFKTRHTSTRLIDTVRDFQSSSQADMGTSCVNLACLEEIAWRNGWIDSDALMAEGRALEKNGYGQYMISLLESP